MTEVRKDRAAKASKSLIRQRPSHYQFHFNRIHHRTHIADGTYHSGCKPGKRQYESSSSSDISKGAEK